MAEATIKDNWKEKYYKAVVDQDHLEMENKEGLDKLYKELLRALGHFRGHDTAFDESISRLPKKADLADIPFEELKHLNYQISEMLDGLMPLADDQSNQCVSPAPKIAPYTVAKELLQYLIEKLPEIVVGKIDSRKLESAFHQANDDINVLRAINDDIEMALSGVLESQDKKVAELSGFLCAIIKRLDGFKAHFTEEKFDRKTRSSERKKLGDFLGSNLDQIRTSVAAAESIEQLQVAIDSRIDEIDSKVTSYVYQETLRADKAEKSSVALEDQLEKLQLQTNQLRESLETARSDAIVDPLTNVSNRRAYDDRFNIEYTRWKRYREPLTLAIMDIDHFKSVNDTYGHPIGDKVLKVVAERIQSQVRESDFFGRIGGEEFAFILVNSDIESAMTKVEALRASVESCNFTVKTEKLQVTISIGVATFNGEDTIESIYQRADEALIKAKQTGRNKSLSELDL
jgi:diguanylate cyclase (GGDEF)-like protein